MPCQICMAAGVSLVTLSVIIKKVSYFLGETRVMSMVSLQSAEVKACQLVSSLVINTLTSLLATYTLTC